MNNSEGVRRAWGATALVGSVGLGFLGAMRFSPDTIGGLSGTALASSVALAGLGLAIAVAAGGPVRESLGLGPPRFAN